SSILFASNQNEMRKDTRLKNIKQILSFLFPLIRSIFHQVFQGNFKSFCFLAKVTCETIPAFTILVIIEKSVFS
ncbi:12038_t:CDS:1, partial [Acaulospora colombiana]